MAEYKIERLHESSTPLNVTLVNGDNWNNVKSVDFGGANVTLSGNFTEGESITSITNGTILNDEYSMFTDCGLLETFDCGLPNLTDGTSNFDGCHKLKSFKVDMPKLATAYSMFYACSSLTEFISDIRSIVYPQMFEECTALKQVEMVLPKSKSGLTQTDFSIPTTAPCTAYRYVADVPKESDVCKVVFTSEKEIGFKGYQIQYGVGANRFSAITQTIDGLELVWASDWDGSDLTPSGNHVEIILGTLAEMADNGKEITLTNNSKFDIVVHINYYSAEGISVPKGTSKTLIAEIGQDTQSPSRFNGGYGVLDLYKKVVTIEPSEVEYTTTADMKNNKLTIGF